jgi:hypothetical protein
MLFQYMKFTQKFIRDTDQSLINPGDIIDYVNRARREVAMRAQCVRVLPPDQGSVASITVVHGGTGYTNPFVEITEADFPGGEALFPLGSQATATANVVDGVITNIDVSYGGSGYFQPRVFVRDPTGIGAKAFAVTSPVMKTRNGQEIYAFKDIPLDSFPGVGEVIAVKSISIIYANYRYSLPMYSFSTYQSMIRQYPGQYYYVPTMSAQRGQGAAGSLYLYPLPSQEYQLELDCFCWPQDLETDQDVEAIPAPWTEAVPYLTAHYCYLELQNLNAANYYRKMFDEMMPRYRIGTEPGRPTNPYGRW